MGIGMDGLALGFCWIDGRLGRSSPVQQSTKFPRTTHQEAKFCSWHMATMLAPARKESAGSVNMSHCGRWCLGVKEAIN